MKLIFCMQIDIKGFLQIDTHFRCAWQGMHKLLKVTSLLFIWNIWRKNWVIKLIFCMQISTKVPNKLLLWFFLLCEIYPFCNYFFPSQHYLFWISFFWCSIVSLWGFSHAHWPLIESSSFFSSLSGFSFMDTGNSLDTGDREGTIFYLTLTLPPTHEHSDTYFAILNVRWLSHISNCTTCIFKAATWWDLPSYQTTLWVIGDVMSSFVCLLFGLIQGFCYSYLTLETGGLELALTVVLALQVNWKTKCATHP